ncbi:MAG: PQQ-binding-like beta-propeller repeat protein [Planctomycetes bacterium]|nr:PQQ-binding-like beta-propeller repeat protein [Planctomycetota bacterium]
MRPTINLRAPHTIVMFLNGNVVRVDPLTGQVMWVTRQPKGVNCRIATIVIDGDMVLVGANGHIFALDVEDGRILWVNELKGMGYGLVTIATGADPEGQSSQQGAAGAAAAAAAAAAAMVATTAAAGAVAAS